MTEPTLQTPAPITSPTPTMAPSEPSSSTPPKKKNVSDSEYLMVVLSLLATAVAMVLGLAGLFGFFR
ncbi:MAG: hypothetical protein AB7N76_35965 [Planctomycetota bacterium]